MLHLVTPDTGNDGAFMYEVRGRLCKSSKEVVILCISGCCSVTGGAGTGARAGHG